MTNTKTMALVGLLAMATGAQRAYAQQIRSETQQVRPVLKQVSPIVRTESGPHNDYGTMSEEVARQRLKLAGYTNVTLTRTAAGYQAATMKDGRPHVLQIDGARGHISESSVRIRLPEAVRR